MNWKYCFIVIHRRSQASFTLGNSKLSFFFANAFNIPSWNAFLWSNILICGTYLISRNKQTKQTYKHTLVWKLKQMTRSFRRTRISLATTPLRLSLLFALFWRYSESVCYYFSLCIPLVPPPIFLIYIKVGDRKSNI